VIPRPANSIAATRVTWSTNAFAPEYKAMPGTAVLVTPDEMFTTRPPSASVSATACIIRNGPRASTATTRSNSASDVCATAPQCVIPALFTRMSSRPNSPVTAVTAASTVAAAVATPRSACTVNARRPRSRT